MDYDLCSGNEIVKSIGKKVAVVDLRRIDQCQDPYFENYLERQSNRQTKMKLLAALTEESIPTIKMKDLKEQALRRECRKRNPILRLRMLTKADLKKFMGEKNYKIAKREHHRRILTSSNENLGTRDEKSQVKKYKEEGEKGQGPKKHATENKKPEGETIKKIDSKLDLKKKNSNHFDFAHHLFDSHRKNPDINKKLNVPKQNSLANIEEAKKKEFLMKYNYDYSGRTPSALNLKEKSSIVNKKPLKMGPASKMNKNDIAPVKTSSYPLSRDSSDTSIDKNVKSGTKSFTSDKVKVNYHNS